MQESKNCELLFEYLRSILYDAKIETLNIFDLDEPYRKLGQGLQFLENASGEMKYPCKSKSSDLAGKTGGKRRLRPDGILSGGILRSI